MLVFSQVSGSAPRSGRRPEIFRVADQHIERSVAGRVGRGMLSKQVQHIDEVRRRAEHRTAVLALAEIQIAKEAGHRWELLDDGVLGILHVGGRPGKAIDRRRGVQLLGHWKKLNVTELTVWACP